jgi:hypothetical protein
MNRFAKSKDPSPVRTTTALARHFHHRRVATRTRRPRTGKAGEHHKAFPSLSTTEQNGRLRHRGRAGRVAQALDRVGYPQHVWGALSFAFFAKGGSRACGPSPHRCVRRNVFNDSPAKPYQLQFRGRPRNFEQRRTTRMAKKRDDLTDVIREESSRGTKRPIDTEAIHAQSERKAAILQIFRAALKKTCAPS